MIDIKDCKSLNDIAKKLYNKINYTNREKVKKYLLENGINWQDWILTKKQGKKLYCLSCGKELKSGQKKFCSQSCSASYNNRHRQHKSNGLNKKTNNGETNEFCIVCHTELTKHQNKFCSIQCQKNYIYNNYITRWQKGEENGLRGKYGLSLHIRRFLLEKNKCKCELCGWGELNPYTKKTPLEVHHKDGNYSNNQESNLQLLCPNCHSLTDTFKNHNKEGRKGREKYL